MRAESGVGLPLSTGEHSALVSSSGAASTPQSLLTHPHPNSPSLRQEAPGHGSSGSVAFGSHGRPALSPSRQKSSTRGVSARDRHPPPALGPSRHSEIPSAPPLSTLMRHRSCTPRPLALTSIPIGSIGALEGGIMVEPSGLVGLPPSSHPNSMGVSETVSAT